MDLRNKVVLVTGASRGIGAELARSFAERGSRLVLSAQSKEGLSRVRDECMAKGAEASVVAGDIRDCALDAQLLAAADALGGCDLLVNNAGIETVGSYRASPWESAEATLAVNLLAPMRLAHRVLPGMVERRRGHIVNIASLAGLAGAAWGEAYCASKHGLVGFTRALRATMKEEGLAVSASVICPGFVSAVGMYAEMVRSTGEHAPSTMGEVTPEAVTRAVFEAIRSDQPLLIVNPRPVSPMLALASFAPRLAERLQHLLGAHRVFAALAKHRSEKRLPDGP